MLAAGNSLFSLLSAQLSHAARDPFLAKVIRGVSPTISKRGTTKAMVARSPITFRQSNLNLMTIKKMYCKLVSNTCIYQQKILKTNMTIYLRNYPGGRRLYRQCYSVELKRRAALLECTETHAWELIIPM